MNIALGKTLNILFLILKNSLILFLMELLQV